VIREAKSLRIIYTPLHGTGSVIIKPMLTRLGFNFQVVPEQDRFDGRFPTVKSPNPENAEALTMAINLAEKQDADLVVATDPDCDRMGAAVRGKDGKMKLLTGNQTGSLLAWYRIKTLIDKGVLNEQNAARAVIIKTFVTTDLQKAIADPLRLALCRNANRLQIHRREAGQVRARNPGTAATELCRSHRTTNATAASRTLFILRFRR
jgi:phosphoglucomutase